MHNTGNPLGSKDILDLYDNSETIDQFTNSQQDEVPDRFGTKRLTLAGLIKRSMVLRNEINDFSGALTFRPEWSDVPMNVSVGVGGEGGALNLQAEALGNRSEINKVTSREALRRSYAEAGYNVVGTFQAGFTIVNANDVGIDLATGKAFSGPAGTVAAGTVPSGPNYTNRGDGTLRSDLANPDKGAAMVARGVVAVDSIADLLALPEGQRKAGLRYMVASYYGGWSGEVPYIGPRGGGEFVYDASRAEENDGGRVLDGFVRVVREATLTPDMYGITTRLEDAADNALRFEKLMASGVPRILFERLYTSSASVVVPASVKILDGVGMYISGVSCTASDEHVFTIEESTGWVVRNIRASHTAKGEGDGFHIQGTNRSFSMYNALASNCNNGFHFSGAVYVGSLYSCRTNSSNTGFRSTNAAGNSTSFNLEHCYATDITEFGFNFSGCHTINLAQPIMDVNNSACKGFIRIGNCSVTNISNAHLEGRPNVAGAAVTISGSNCDIVNIDGFHSDLACASENLWYFLFLHFAGNVRVQINGVDATKSSNLGLYWVRNNAANHDYIEIGTTNRFGTTATRSRNDVAGELTVNNPTIRGLARGVKSNDRTQTGLHGAPQNIQLTMRNEVGRYASVIPSYDEVGSDGSFKIRFTNITDGLPNTSGAFDVDWQVSRTFS